jgi:hypothetical protein
MIRGDFHAPQPGIYFQNSETRCVEGHHRPEGIYIGFGRAFESLDRESMNMRDVAPSVLKALGVSPPSPMEGEPVSVAPEGPELENVPEEVLAIRDGGHGRWGGTDDEQSVRERLRQLGYMS